MPTKKKKSTVETAYTEVKTTEEPVAYVKPVETKKTLKDVVAMFPEAKLPLTQRYYGETFFPQYEAALRELKTLAQ